MEQHRPAVSTAGFWEALYAGGDDGWELGMAAPPLAAWLDSGGEFAPADARGGGGAGAISGPPQMSMRGRVAVPGCGRGHDARLLACRGYQVWGFDFVAPAVEEARCLAAEAGVAVTFEQRDIFGLADPYAGFFDGVWEYTCFCAIDPARREEYARLVHAILRPGGTLLACFFPMRGGEDGPPFPVSRPEVERVLAPWFDLVESGPPAVSVERRRGLEWLVRARRRG